jgi:hypothetical protein
MSTSVLLQQEIATLKQKPRRSKGLSRGKRITRYAK